MHTLAFVNQKGGCGKTTSAVNLAGALAARGARVLLVDLDPQSHATLGLGCALRGEPSIADVLVGGRTAADVLRRVSGGIDLLPATPALAEFEEVAARSIQPERVLERALATLGSRYDFALLDCPPRTDGVLAKSALRAADTAVLVVEAGAFALQGATLALGVLEELAQELEHPLAVRVLGTLFDRRTRFARELLIAMHARFGELLFDAVIHTSVRLREAAASGQPVAVLDPTSRAAIDFDHLAAEVRAHAARRAERRAASSAELSSRPWRAEESEHGFVGGRRP